MSATGVAELTGLPTYSHTAAVAFRARRALLWIVPLALAALLSGCAGTVSPKNSQTNVPPPPAQTFGVSGTINPTAGGSGATVTLSGAASATTTANSSGAYNFTGLANGTYAVTPSHSGYTFSPSVQPATINGANITGLNFTATQVSAAQAHSVSLSWDAEPVNGLWIQRISQHRKRQRICKGECVVGGRSELCRHNRAGGNDVFLCDPGSGLERRRKRKF